jgi:hypothetical protein
VYTYQYGWLWMPYEDRYTYVPPVRYAVPYAYLYYPAYGWGWVAAPWICGVGPWPYFGVGVAFNFGWYSGAYWSHSSHSHHAYGYARPAPWHRPAPAPGYRRTAPAPRYGQLAPGSARSVPGYARYAPGYVRSAPGHARPGPGSLRPVRPGSFFAAGRGGGFGGIGYVGRGSGGGGRPVVAPRASGRR